MRLRKCRRSRARSCGRRTRPGHATNGGRSRPGVGVAGGGALRPKGKEEVIGASPRKSLVTFVTSLVVTSEFDSPAWEQSERMARWSGTNLVKVTGRCPLHLPTNQKGEPIDRTRHARTPRRTRRVTTTTRGTQRSLYPNLCGAHTDRMRRSRRCIGTDLDPIRAGTHRTIHFGTRRTTCRSSPGVPCPHLPRWHRT